MTLRMAEQQFGSDFEHTFEILILLVGNILNQKRGWVGVRIDIASYCGRKPQEPSLFYVLPNRYYSQVKSHSTF